MQMPRNLPHLDLLRRLQARYGRKGSGRPRGDAGEPALVEPDKPNPPLAGGAAAPLDEESV